MLNIDPDKFYCVKDAASIFGIHINTIYKWIQQGKLPVVDINGRLYIPGEVIINLIRAAVRICQAGKKIEKTENLLPEDMKPEADEDL